MTHASYNRHTAVTRFAPLVLRDDNVPRYHYYRDQPAMEVPAHVEAARHRASSSLSYSKFYAEGVTSAFVKQ
ncbi:MAG: hypothetical protein LBS59_01390 [Puniceicoccales bacterium]|jgi:hypothetical protein|nr:hypothetical protein [Puniceicoccales bacterium]